MIKLSIIVPVYNVEKYIHSCFECIFRQELDETEFEVIIVNDGTKDNSMEKIADFIKEHSNISVINQENQGLSVARNNGIAKAKGEYVYMPDPDDLLIDNYLSVLLDIVVLCQIIQQVTHNISIEIIVAAKKYSFSDICNILLEKVIL